MSWLLLERAFDKLFENFNLDEFACKDELKTVVPDLFVPNYTDTVKAIQFVRYILGHAIIIVSGYRTPHYNKSKDGASKSLHTYDASAVDFKLKFPFNTKKNLQRIYTGLDFAQKNGMITPGGLHLYKSFIHIDTRGRLARW